MGNKFSKEKKYVATYDNDELAGRSVPTYL